MYMGRNKKRKKGGRQNCVTSIDGTTGEKDIFYAKDVALYRSVPYDPAEMNELTHERGAWE